MWDHEMTLGTFDTGDQIHVSDPCYADLDTLCAQTVKVRPGRWRATAVRDHSGLVAQLTIRHTEAAAWHPWKQLNDHIGVDSGQCGFFSLDQFRNNPSAARYQFRSTDKDTLAVLEAIKADQGAWYARCCDITLCDDMGVLPGGVVSNSGYGDGGYNLLCQEEDGEIVGLSLEFIIEEDEADDDAYYEEEWEDEEPEDEWDPEPELEHTEQGDVGVY